MRVRIVRAIPKGIVNQFAYSIFLKIKFNGENFMDTPTFRIMGIIATFSKKMIQPMIFSVSMNVIMLSVVILSVMAPFDDVHQRHKECFIH
jgi:hypothetical protein